MIRVVCAWCGAFLYLVPSLDRGVVDSHGICAPCKATLLGAKRFATARMIERAKEG